ncbi:MAG: transposase [Saprospiraceae bacterium]|jgi:putative transposase|nr:transposase [Saprospiraceae bacterium]
MEFIPNHLYHIYNHGNNREPIFFAEENYRYFLGKVRLHVKPYCHILAWCLMPNHFHFLIGTDARSTPKRRIGNIEMSELSNGFRILESSYTKGVNRQQGRSGSLFRQHTKAKCLTEEAFDFESDPALLAPDFLNMYPLVCFHYIHQNPEKAGLVTHDTDWEYSSLRDYLGLRNGTLCNYDLAFRWVGVPTGDLADMHPVKLEEEKVAGLF